MWTLPNIITLVRICFTPVIALLPFIEGYWPKLIAFVIFLAAAISDIYDGHLARSRNEVTDLGKLLDPIADKLLLFATLIPIYWISRARHDLYDIPIWGSIPLWVCLLLIGREVAMTVFRMVGQPARRRHRRRPGRASSRPRSRTSSSGPSSCGSPSATRGSRWAGSTAATPTTGTSSTAGSWRWRSAVATLLTVYSFVLYSTATGRCSPTAAPEPSAGRPPLAMNIELAHHRHRAAARLHRGHQRRGDRPRAVGGGRARRPPDQRERRPGRHPGRRARRARAGPAPCSRPAGSGPPATTSASRSSPTCSARRSSSTRRSGTTWCERFAALGRTPVAEQPESRPTCRAGATVLPNRWGTAPGLWLEGAPGLVIMLPGVPGEMRKLLEHEVVPRLRGAGRGRR